MKIVAFVVTILSLLWMGSAEVKCCSDTQAESDKFILQAYLNSLR